MQPQPDQGYKFIVVYLDHLTKFALVRPLQSNTAGETAFQLNDAFYIFGAPCILNSDNGREFVNSVITEISTLLLELKIVHGKPRQTEYGGFMDER